MFPAFCRHVVSEVGKDTLIPSPSIDEAKQLLPLNVVTMREKKKFCFFSSIEISTHDISLKDLLTDHDELVEATVKELPYCSINNPATTYLLNWKIGANMNDIIDASVSANDKVEMSVKLGNLLCEEIGDTSFVNALMKRRLDTENTLIKQIKDTNTVLCVVKGVIKTSQQAEIKLIEKKDCNLEVNSKVAANIGAAATRFQNMGIEKGTILAYKVWKLNVYLDGGKMDPIMTNYGSGGFFKSDEEEQKDSSGGPSPMDDEEEQKDSSGGPSPMDETEKKKKKLQDSPKTWTLYKKASVYSPMKAKDEDPLKNLKEILQPLRDCTEADGQPIKSSLLVLMTYSRDVSTLSKILSKAEHGCLIEDKDTLDKHFINNDAVRSILKFVGFQIEEGRILFQMNPTPKLMAVAYMIDAIVELENYDLEKICHYNEPQLKTLSEIFESAISSSKTIFMPSVLTRSVNNFLAGLGFRVMSKDSTLIIPPKVKSCVAECFFCVLYCLSS